MPFLFKVDENLPVEVAQALRSRGHDATTAEEQQLGGARDEQLSRISKQEGRVLVTLDLDFADIRTYRPQDHPGIVVFRLGKQDKPAVLEATDRLLRVLATMDPTGRLLIVEDRRIRLRGGPEGEEGGTA